MSTIRFADILLESKKCSRGCRLPSVRGGTLGGSTASARGGTAGTASTSFTDSEKAAIFSGAVGVLAKVRRVPCAITAVAITRDRLPC